MAATRKLPPYAERTALQHIESGWRLDIVQKAQYDLWDSQILLWKLKGRTIDEIGAMVGCSPGHARKRIPILLKAEGERMAELAALEIVTQLASLEVLLSEVRVEWERSCLDFEETVIESEGGGTYKERSDGTLDSVPAGAFKQRNRSTKYGRSGDPRLVEQLRAIMADKRKLLRLDKDEELRGVLDRISFTQVNISAGDGPIVPIAAMTPSALAELTELLSGLGMGPDGLPLRKMLPAPFDESKDEKVIDAEYAEAVSG